LDPVTKLAYLEAAWEDEYIEVGKKCLKEQVSLDLALDSLCLLASFSSLSIRPGMKLRRKTQRSRMLATSHLISVSCRCSCSYAKWIDHVFLDLSATDSWMEKLIKKKKRQDAKDGNSTRSVHITTTDGEDDPFEEITRWFGTKRLNRVVCPNPITWWGVCILSLSKDFVLMFAV
jgi:hypothetical protein